MNSSIKLRWIYGISAAFILLNAVFLFFEIYWFTLLPVALGLLLLALFSSDILLLIIVFLTPLSVNLEKLEFGLGIALPTEPLIFILMLVFFLKLLYEKRYDSKIIRHPISLAIIFHLVWIFLTTFTSEMPLVSVKFFVSRLWFVAVFYFFAIMVFRQEKNIKRFFWLYIIPFTGVIIYTVINHSLHGFEEDPAHWVMWPFYKDHTSYGAILAMFFPVLFFFLLGKFSLTVRFFTFIVISIFIIGLIFSYTRAAWVSLIAAFCLLMVYYFRIRFVTIMATGFVVIGLLFAFWTDIVMKLEKNKQDTSSDLAEHVQSISNIRSDASNLERINRWQSAFRMFNERPVFGWGPGTYMFQYAPFQHSSEQTIISTNAADLGNAHSEYIGPLAEQGILGALGFLLILITVYITATRLYFTLRDKEHKQIVLVVVLGLTTYFVHGLLNNFLDTDKASVPFWGFIAMLVALDIYGEKELESAIK